MIKNLAIDREFARRITTDGAKKQFAFALALAVEDGELDKNEQTILNHIAGTVGCTATQFAQQFFREEGVRFLKGLFLEFTLDNVLGQREWENLLDTTSKLGISQTELVAAIELQARQFVEHVLADAKSDGQIAAEEEQNLSWLLRVLQLPTTFQQYVQREVQFVQQLMAIENGKLPSLDRPPGIATTAGELIHYHGASTWEFTKQSRSGSHTDSHQGLITLTDNRLLFSGSTRSLNVRYSSVVAHDGGPGWFTMRCSGKPDFIFRLSEKTALPYYIFKTAVGMANQVVVNKGERDKSRFIPREVRQRVWQKFGGRCAECDATDYLRWPRTFGLRRGAG